MLLECHHPRQLTFALGFAKHRPDGGPECRRCSDRQCRALGALFNGWFLYFYAPDGLTKLSLGLCGIIDAGSGVVIPSGQRLEPQQCAAVALRNPLAGPPGPRSRRRS